MKYGSVCSGIEAASVAWESLGWQAQWYSEIEHFPSEVLAHRFPTVPNLGDMTLLMENKIFLESEIDVLVGGTPCQPFSVAGLRKGLQDPRGNLMLTFLALVNKKRPKWVVWENVPGVLSTNGGQDFKSFLDGLNELGYICDVEILDAQFFGVAQRRRRVFVCAQSREDFLKKKTSSSALTIAQCLVEILHSIFRETLGQSGRELLKLEQIALSKDGVKRRMSLFEIATENCTFKMLQNHLIDAFLKSQPEVRHWEFQLGGKVVPDSTLEDLLMGSKKTNPYILTEESLRKCLEEVYEVMKSFITLTSTNKITPHQIYICLKAERLIGGLICRLSDSSPSSLGAGLSFLMYNQEVTNYARQASRELFEELDGVHSWSDILWQTQHTSTVIGYLGDWRPAGAVLFERNRLSGNTEKSREKRKATSADAEGSVGSGGQWWNGEQTAATLTKQNANGAQRMPDKDNFGAVLEPKTHAFKVRGGSEVETGEQGGTPGKKAGKGYLGQDEKVFTIGTTQDKQIAQPVAVDLYNQTINATTHHTLRSDASHNEYGAVMQPVAVDCYNFTTNENTTQTICSKNDKEHIGAVLQPNISPTITQCKGSRRGSSMEALDEVSAIHAQQPTMAIRRLTPIECELLQGFPRNWTLIPYRNKPAEQCPDGPRYKACGNSMAVPCMAYLGRRIQMVEDLLKEQANESRVD
jgi:DNA-cytosine methyltransferase